MKMTQEIRKILEVIINHYYEDIQWWSNDKEEQAYADVDKIVEWLKEEKMNNNNNTFNDVLKLVDLRNAINFALEKNLYGFEMIGVGTGYGACDIDFYYKNKNYHIALTERGKK
jgi:hypothetical protein|tara:strand:- start:428 stop:769 length:342 start_codon:yes stop_codon:yes gene_type:complete